MTSTDPVRPTVDDPEAAWPLLANPAQPQPGTNPPAQQPGLVPYGFPGPVQPLTGQPYAPVAKKESSGPVIAKLAIILGLAIPLTAIAATELGLRGLVVVWMGIAAVAAFALLPGRPRRP